MKLVILAVVLSACSAAKYALLPGNAHYGTRDPDLTRPLVPTPGTEPRPEAGKAPSKGTPGEIMVGPISATVTGVAVLGWLLGGAAPLVGLYGTFDENAIVDPDAPQPQVVPTEQ